MSSKDSTASDHTAQTAAQAVTGNYQLTVQMPDGKNLVISGYLYDGESVESINDRLDLIAGVADRQRTMAEIPELEKKLKAAHDRLREYREFCAALVAKQQSNPKQLSGQEKQQLDAMDVNIKKLSEDIAEGERVIAECKAKVGQA